MTAARKPDDFQALIDRSSIGEGLRDIRERGINAHLADLEREGRTAARRYRRRRHPRAPAAAGGRHGRGDLLALRSPPRRARHDLPDARSAAARVLPPGPARTRELAYPVTCCRGGGAGAVPARRVPPTSTGLRSA